ncbi:hypothetical protein AB7M17_004171 [Bradyrhizobium sp. USDA 377]
MSCAMRRSPRGSIQRPKRGKKLKMPPRMSPPATMIRIQSLDGSRSQRMKVPTFVGTERSINVKYLFSPTVTEAMPNPIRVSVKEPHRKMLLGTKPAGGRSVPRSWLGSAFSIAAAKRLHKRCAIKQKPLGRYTERLFFAAPSLLVLPPNSSRLLTPLFPRASGCQLIGGADETNDDSPAAVFFNECRIPTCPRAVSGMADGRRGSWAALSSSVRAAV